MALTVSDKQLEAIDSERQPVVVRHSRTKKGYAVMPESVYQHVRPLIEFMFEKGATAGHDETCWTDAKNARRVALINKKYDSKLSAGEKRELALLQDEVCRFQERIASQRNVALELIVQVLEQRAKDSPPRQRERAGQLASGLKVRRKQAHGNQHPAKTDTAVGVDPE